MNQTQSGYQKISLGFSLFKTLDNCRLCHGKFFPKTLKLKETCAANELYPSQESAKKATKFPLEVVMCSECKHVQLLHIVSPQRLFDDYVYKSGISNFFVKHFEELAKLVASEYPISSYVLEVGSNDGTLLTALKRRDIKAIGLEPSANLVNGCNSAGLEVIQAYLDKSSVSKLLTEHGQASIVIGNNVFAHIEDMREAFTNVFDVLNETGLFIFEVAHFKNILSEGIFDTIYHEHMSYHTVLALQPFAKEFGFKITKIQKISPHGGSLRFFLSKKPGSKVDSSVNEIIAEEIELGLDQEKVLTSIENRIRNLRKSISGLIKEANEATPSIIFGYGAPAKVVTFLAQMELEELNLIGIIDDNQDKQNKFLPGTGFPIKSTFEMKSALSHQEKIENKVITCLIFPWNLNVEILEKLRDFLPKKSKVIWFFPQPQKVEL